LRSERLHPLVVDALLADETRPRIAPFGNGLMLILRGVNPNAGADPDDMVALRVWIEPKRLITMRTRRLMAAQDVRDEIDAGKAPTTVVETLVRLIHHWSFASPRSSTEWTRRSTRSRNA
jgi:zinc transporter